MLPKYMLGSGLQCGWCWLFGWRQWVCL
jgi:hypothetical protein